MKAYIRDLSKVNEPGIVYVDNKTWNDHAFYILLGLIIAENYSFLVEYF